MVYSKINAPSRLPRSPQYEKTVMGKYAVAGIGGMACEINDVRHLWQLQYDSFAGQASRVANFAKNGPQKAILFAGEQKMGFGGPKIGAQRREMGQNRLKMAVLTPREWVNGPETALTAIKRERRA